MRKSSPESDDNDKDPKFEQLSTDKNFSFVNSAKAFDRPKSLNDSQCSTPRT